MLIVRTVKMSRSQNADKMNAKRIMAAVSIYVLIRQLAFIVIARKGTFTCYNNYINDRTMTVTTFFSSFSLSIVAYV